MSAEKMNIDVSYVAQLARIELDETTKQRLQSEMEEIVGFVDQLGTLDVEGIEPTAHAAPLTNVLRDDKAGTPYERSTMLANAPATVDDELIKVPPVIPGEEEA